MANGDAAAREMREAADNARVGLVLAGGGARCAYQAGVLKAVSEMLPGRRNPFGVIVGQSAGAINAASLASRADDFGRAVRHLARAWPRLEASDVYRTDVPSIAWRGLLWVLMAASGGWLVRNPRSFLDNAPLGGLVARQIDFDAIESAIARGRLSALALTASVYGPDSGQAVTFFAGGAGREEWARVRRSGVRSRLGVEHVLASAALPFLFPAQRIGRQFYGDGALRMTAPLSPAIRLGARRLLVIAPRDAKIVPLDSMALPEYPSLGVLAGHMLDIIFNDYLEADIERLERINSTLSLLTADQLAETPLRPVETFVLRPSEDIRGIAARHAGAIPWPVRAMLRGIGGWRGDWRLPSYLNFGGPYCRELVALGRRDAWANADRIVELLTAPGPPSAAETASPGAAEARPLRRRSGAP